MSLESGVELYDTALHEAVRYSDVDLVKSSLRDGLDANQIGLYQWSPLHEAAQIGDVDVLKLLLKHQGDPNHHDLLKGFTAVHYAAQEGHIECLTLLLKAGGRAYILNNEGQSSIDVATAECRKVLAVYALTDTVDSTEDKLHSSSKVVPAATSYASLSPVCQKSPVSQDIKSLEGSTKSSEPDSSWESSLDPDLDIVSLDSMNSGSSDLSNRSIGRAWGENNVVGMKKLVLGHIQMSFEYNSKATSLKIRVWQVANLLMPPADTSMINSIYVKSYLLPDKKKSSKRRTEEISIYKNENSKYGLQAPQTKDNTIFKPSTFGFQKALEYKNITKEIISEKMIHIEVCIIQKYTRRSFVVCSWNSPLKFAVKKLVKATYPLTPRMSTELPEHMKVYSGNQLSVVHGYHSRPNSTPPSRFPSVSSVHIQERACSDSDLKQATNGTGRIIPSIEITVPDEEEEIELQEMLHEIAVLERRERSVEVSMSSDSSIQSDGGKQSYPGLQTDPHEVCVQADVHLLEIKPKSSSTSKSNVSSSNIKKQSDTKKRPSLLKRYSSKFKQKKEHERDKDDSVFEMLSWSSSPELGRSGKRPSVSMIPMDFEHDDAFTITTHSLKSGSLDLPIVHRVSMDSGNFSTSDINDNLDSTLNSYDFRSKKGRRKKSYVELNIPEELGLSQFRDGSYVRKPEETQPEISSV